VITAQLFGGPRDGERVTVAAPYAPVPDVLQFPEPATPPDFENRPADPLAVAFRSVSYRLRPAPRCCAAWCMWPRPCTCCPQCAAKPLIYDLVRTP
jgi:hypothetical protein